MGVKRTPVRLFQLVLVAVFAQWKGSRLIIAAEKDGENQVKAGDYFEPSSLSGAIYAKHSDRKEVLFTFKRTAARSGSTVRVNREFLRPDGRLAARERVVYEAGRLVSYELEELESGATGSAVVKRNPQNPRQQMIFLEYSEGSTRKEGSEKLGKDTVINDMVGPFIQAHWGELMGGATVRLRFVAIARAETVGFKLTKESETTWRGKPVVIIKMEPTSFIISQFVEPLSFTVEKNGSHRVLQYMGRTTPRIRTKNKWEDFEAVTVFDWK
jgi:hypothetical protein